MAGGGSRSAARNNARKISTSRAARPQADGAVAFVLACDRWQASRGSSRNVQVLGAFCLRLEPMRESDSLVGKPPEVVK